MGVSSVSEYIENLNEDGKQYVNEFMQKEYPNLLPKISFSMPMWLVGKKMSEGYIAISAAKNHFSNEKYLEKMATELTTCKT